MARSSTTAANFLLRDGLALRPIAFVAVVVSAGSAKASAPGLSSASGTHANAGLA